jgi:hypothetical protein
LDEASLENSIDRLFQTALPEFTEARNRLTSDLRSQGEPEAAARVKSLLKPSVSAWAANQLYWRQRDAWDRLVDLGDRWRSAQQRVLAGEALAEERRSGLGAAREHCRRFLSELGQGVGAAVLARLGETLEAIATYGSAAPLTARGRLSADLAPPGFAALKELASAPLPPRLASSPVPDRRESKATAERDLARARLELAEAQREARDRRADAAIAREAEAEAAAHLESARRELDEARRQLIVATERVEEKASKLRAARGRGEEAAAVAARAEERLARASAHLENID